MTVQILTSLIGAVGFAVTAFNRYRQVRSEEPVPAIGARIAVTIALSVGAGYICAQVYQHGAATALQQSYTDTILLGFLIGLTGFVTWLSNRLKGLDGVLFAAAALVSLVSLAQVSDSPNVIASQGWFVSHSIAFALSGTLFLAGGLAGVVYLMVYHRLRRKQACRLLGRVASLEALEKFGRWMPNIGFPLFTYGILTGICGVWHRTQDVKQTAWYLDPAFIFSMIAWMVYGYLCYGSLFKPQVRGRRAAVLSTYGLGLVVVAFLFREFLSPIHQ